MRSARAVGRRSGEGRDPERSLNGSSLPGRPVQDVDQLTALVSGQDRRQEISPEDPAHADSQDLELLQRIHALGPLGPFASLRHRGSVNRLVREGLLTLDGVLDTAGEGFMGPISDAHDVLAVRGRCGGQRTLMQCWMAGGTASVVSGPPGPDLVASVDGLDRRRYTALTLDRSSLASHACAWAGVRTFPAALGQELLIPEDVFTQRVSDSCTPLPPLPQIRVAAGRTGGGVDPSEDPEAQPTLEIDPEVLTGWWSEPWFVWEVTSARLGVNLGLISAHGAGNYVFGGDRVASERAGEPLVRVAPVSAQSVWETLWLLAHGGGEDGAAGRSVLEGKPQRGPLGQVPELPRHP